MPSVFLASVVYIYIAALKEKVLLAFDWLDEVSANFFMPLNSFLKRCN